MEMKDCSYVTIWHVTCQQQGYNGPMGHGHFPITQNTILVSMMSRTLAGSSCRPHSALLPSCSCPWPLPHSLSRSAWWSKWSLTLDVISGTRDLKITFLNIGRPILRWLAVWPWSRSLTLSYWMCQKENCSPQFVLLSAVIVDLQWTAVLKFSFCYRKINLSHLFCAPDQSTNWDLVVHLLSKHLKKSEKRKVTCKWAERPFGKVKRGRGREQGWERSWPLVQYGQGVANQGGP